MSDTELNTIKKVTSFALKSVGKYSPLAKSMLSQFALYMYGVLEPENAYNQQAFENAVDVFDYALITYLEGEHDLNKLVVLCEKKIRSLVHKSSYAYKHICLISQLNSELNSELQNRVAKVFRKYAPRTKKIDKFSECLLYYNPAKWDTEIYRYLRKPGFKNDLLNELGEQNNGII